MCYHYSLKADKYQLEERFTAKMLDEYEAIYHNDGFSHKAMPVITADEPDKIQLYHWGLIPHWSKYDPTLVDKSGNKISAFKQAYAGPNTLNAIGEEIWEKPSYRMYVKEKRCMVLADGIIEWHHSERKDKIPYYIYLKDKRPFAFGGVYSHWNNPETGEVLKSFTIITTPANELMRKIHNSKMRMPLILRPDIERNWIQKGIIKDEVNNLIQPLEVDLMAAHPISKLVSQKKVYSNIPEALVEHPYPEFVIVC